MRNHQNLITGMKQLLNSKCETIVAGLVTLALRVVRVTGGLRWSGTPRKAYAYAAAGRAPAADRSAARAAFFAMSSRGSLRHRGSASGRA